MSGEGARPAKNAPAARANTDLYSVTVEAQRIADHADYRQRILDLLPDEALEHAAALASDEAVAAAYRTLARRRSA